jgi:hypothetical protein
LNTGEDGNAGHLSLGIDSALSGNKGHAYGVIDYSHHITNTPLGEFSAFAKGFGGMTLLDGRWQPELGATAGIGFSW